MWYIVIVLLSWSDQFSCADSSINWSDYPLGWANVTINGKEIKKSHATGSDNNPEFHETFSYFDGEAIDIICDKNYTMDSIRMNLYSNAYNDYISINTSNKFANKNENIRLFLKLTKENDGNYVLCTLMSDRINKTSAIRISFSLKHEKKDLGFLVNSLIVPETNKISRKEYNFEYQYYDGENVAVETIKDDTIYKDVSCDVPDRDSTPVLIFKFNKLLEEKNNITAVPCTWSRRGNGTNDIKSIVFGPSSGVGPEKGPIIKGLSAGKIIAKYEPDEYNYTIVYDYYDYDELNVECSCKLHSCDMKKLTLINDINTIKTKESHTGKSKSLYKLKAGEKSGRITCSTVITVKPWERGNPTAKNMTKNTNIILIRRSPDVTKDNPKYKTEQKYKPDSNSNLVIFIASILLVLFLVVIVGLIGIKLFQVRRNKPKVESYETLPEHNKGPMPVPEQWRDVQYTLPTDSAQNADYAVPHKPNLEEMYAKPQKTKTIKLNFFKNNIPTPNHDDGTYVNFEKSQYVDMNGSTEILTEPKPPEEYSNVFGSYYNNCNHEYAEILEPTGPEKPK